MSYVVTGFVGTHLIDRLLARKGTIYVLVRAGRPASSDSQSAGGSRHAVRHRFIARTAGSQTK